MPLVEHDEVVEAFPTDGADEAFGVGILPGGARGDEDLTDTHVGDAPSELVPIDRVAISEQIPGRRFIGKGVDHLACRPPGGGMAGDVDMNEFAAIVAENDEGKEQAKSEGRDHEEIDGRDLTQMSGQEGAPGRGGLGDRRGMYFAIVSSATS